MIFRSRFFATIALIYCFAPALALAQTSVTTTSTSVSTTTQTQTQTQTAVKPTCLLTATPSSINVGGSIQLKWQSSNADGGSISGVGAVGTNGSLNLLPPSGGATFVGTFTGPGGSVQCQTTVTVNAQGVTGDATVAPTNTDAPTPVNTVTPAPTPAVSNGPIVQCGNGEDPRSATNCQACNLVDLASRIINFLIGISIPIAAGLFAYAGIVLFLAGDVAERRNKAKEIFQNAFIGFLIAVTAWLVINTILHVILSPTQFPQSHWFRIDCVGTGARPGAGNDANNPNNNINALLQSILPSINAVPFNNTYVNSDGSTGNSSLPTSGAGGSCPQGYVYAENSTEYWCQNPKDTTDWVETNGPDEITVNTNSGTVSGAMAAQLTAACAQYNLTDCSIAQRLALNESSGGANCSTSNTGAAGCMQVLATTACGIDSSISSSCSACLSSKNSISAQCQPVIQTLSSDQQLGTNLGVKYISQLQSMPALQSLAQTYGQCQVTAAAYYRGPGAVRDAGGIPSAATAYVNKACN